MGILTKPRTHTSGENDVEERSPKANVSRNIKRSTKDVYYSDIVGEYIKDAVTGAVQPWRVGTKDEEKFFRVVITSQSATESRKGTYDSSIGRGAHKAFYDTPMTYMKHNHCLLDEEYVKEWYDTKREKFPDLFEA